MLSLNASFSNDNPGDGGRDDNGEPSGVETELDGMSLADDDDGHRTTGAEYFWSGPVDMESECWSAHEGGADAEEALSDLPWIPRAALPLLAFVIAADVDRVPHIPDQLAGISSSFRLLTRYSKREVSVLRVEFTVVDGDEDKSYMPLHK
jgi:hypothetical protein